MKPENILIRNTLNSTPRAFLGDIGTEPCENLIGTKANATAFWKAPELLTPFTSPLIDFLKCDIFSLGLIVLYCIDSPLFISRNHPRYFCDILRQMLSYSPTTRPTFETLYEHVQNFKNYANSKLLAK